MLARIRKAMEEREGGFTLIELLVVIIIGVLAAIAIPTFLNQREKAWKNAMQADLRNNASQMEAYFDEYGTYPDTADLGGAGRLHSHSRRLTLILQRRCSREGVS